MTKQQTVPDRPLETFKRAIVVGASSGIGAALVRELAKQNYIVAAVARRADMLEELCETVSLSSDRGVYAKAYVHDVTDFAAVPDLFQQIVADLGGVDMVVYNAGVMPKVGLDEFDFAKDKLQIEVNLLGGMAWLNQAAMRFQAAKQGNIVAISSVSGDRGRRMNPAYHTSKGALAIFMESLRNRLSQHGVTVTTIKPGFVQTEMLADVENPMWAISPAKAAEIIVTAAEKGVQTKYVPGRWGLVMLIIRHIPSFVFRRTGI